MLFRFPHLFFLGNVSRLCPANALKMCALWFYSWNWNLQPARQNKTNAYENTNRSSVFAIRDMFAKWVGFFETCFFESGNQGCFHKRKDDWNESIANIRHSLFVIVVAETLSIWPSIRLTIFSNTMIRSNCTLMYRLAYSFRTKAFH